ncbi:MAG: pyridoxamine 5'-phosphate oxidase family protein [bacterium]|nr:pyridoxamine 5'-phosphate oxidase family protein [bacterium]
MTNTIGPTDRTRVKRLADRGHYDRETIYPILDEALVCHVAFVHDDHPVSIPAVHGRIGDDLYLHGSVASRMMHTLKGGVPVSISVALVDGLVLGRSILSHSMNYRSVVLFGTAVVVTDEQEKRTALEAVTAHFLPDRWEHIRPPNDAEWAQTQLLRIPLCEGSAKVRTGPPIEESEDDYEIGSWAGVIPLRVTAGEPIPDPRLDSTGELPKSVRTLLERY